MEDYTKFRLKNEDELKTLLDGKDNIFVIACNKCYKEFDAEEEPERIEFISLAEKLSKTIIGSKTTDFLCNKTHIAKTLENTSPDKAGCVFVISCGYGIQTVAELIGLPVYTAANSVNPHNTGGMGKTHHGMALTKLQCEACGQCFLNRTGGVCPIVDCSKSLINGQCGGASRGMCEVDKDKDCAWEKIYIKLEQIGQTSVLSDDNVRLRDYSKINVKLISDYVNSIREKRLEGYYGGLHLHELKERTEHMPLVRFPDNKTDELPKPIRPCENPDNLSADDIISIVKEMGIVGMGGAGFPTHIKLKSPKPIDTVLLNGCECEPLLTADHRVMLEFSDDVISGLNLLLKATGATKGIIAVEDNKPDAIDLLKEKTGEKPDIEIISVKTKYPQGAEKMLIKRVLGRTVQSGALPFDVGVIVSNVSTAKAISDAVIKGLPLTERVVTVSGEKIKNPGNFIVKIGTPVRELIEHCGGLTDSDTRILLGGPMMGNPLLGTEITDLDTPVTKTTNGIIAISQAISEQSPCIRCGRCVDACPMELLPLYYPIYAKKENREGMIEKSVNDCIECGCCDYICPSKIPIREAIKQGKLALRN